MIKKPLSDNHAQDDIKFIKRAIALAAAGAAKGQTPFGAVVVKNGKIIAATHNKVWKKTDITAHAEVEVIRLACRKLRTVDLSGCVIYSSCEPCPMCFSACHWAGIKRVVFAAGIADARQAGFNELEISNIVLKKLSKSSVVVEGGLERAAAVEVFNNWKRSSRSRTY